MMVLIFAVRLTLFRLNKFGAPTTRNGCLTGATTHSNEDGLAHGPPEKKLKASTGRTAASSPTGDVTA